MIPKLSHRYTPYTAERAFNALSSIRDEIQTFLDAVTPSIADLGPDAQGEIAYLRQTITEHLRNQFREACEASAEWFDVDPMQEQPK